MEQITSNSSLWLYFRIISDTVGSKIFDRSSEQISDRFHAQVISQNLLPTFLQAFDVWMNSWSRPSHTEGLTHPNNLHPNHGLSDCGFGAHTEALATWCTQTGISNGPAGGFCWLARLTQPWLVTEGQSW